MSRSRKKTPIHGIAKTSARSMRWYKRLHGKRERARLLELKAAGMIEECDRELNRWNEWDCPRDGKRYYFDDDMRK